MSKEASRTSSLAVASLASGVFACVPYLGVVAVGLGAGALLRIRSAEGRLSGVPFAVVGISLGAFNTLMSLAVTAALLQEDRRPPVVVSAPVVLPAPTPRAPTGGEEGQMTTLDQVTEVQVGAVRLVDVPPTKRSLELELEEQRRAAAASKEKLVLFTSAEGCRPCMSVAAVLHEAKMQGALAGVRLVRVDVNALGQDLKDLGVPTQKIPGFYLLGKELNPVDGINGGEWDDDNADNAGPVLGSFVQGKLRKRREPFVPQVRAPRPPTPGTPRPRGTFL
jgi:thiol-disulfide isomerase/thioredoxin